jgi:hypothetical protein
MSFGQKISQWKEVLFFTMKFGPQKLTKYYTEVTATPGMLLITAHILDCVRELSLFWIWNNGMAIYTEDKGSYTTQYHEAFLKYVGNENWA